MWPWELCELFNLSAAVERAASFDIIHYQSEYYPASLAFGRLTAHAAGADAASRALTRPRSPCGRGTTTRPSWRSRSRRRA